MINDFMSNTKGLTRNPLGIIALFVSLIYGFACLVLSTSISNLNNSTERLPLIWFIILFPIIILLAFLYLVVSHHEKLYAPGDYRGDDSFIKTIDSKKQKEKKLKEIQTLESAPESHELETETINEELTAINMTNESTLETQKIEQLESESKSELTEEELIEIYTNSEKWAINELTLKYKLPFKSNVTFNTGIGRFELDAFVRSGEKTYVVEVKYWQTNKSVKTLKLALQEFILKHSKIEGIFNSNNDGFKLIIVLVYDNLNGINKEDLIDFVKTLNTKAEIEFFEYNELKRNYK